MKFKGILLFGVMVASSLSHASKVDLFIGGGMGYQQTTPDAYMKYSGSKYRPELDSARSVNYSVMAGALYNKVHRFYLTATFAGSDEFTRVGNEVGDLFSADVEQAEYLLSYDYVHNVSNRVWWFGGLSLGTSRSTFNGELSYESGGLVDSMYFDSMVYGAQFGLIYKVDRNWGVDVTYRYMRDSLAETWGDERSEVSANLSIKDHQSLIFGLRYKF